MFDRSMKKIIKFYTIHERNNDLSAFNVSLEKLSAIKFSQVLLEPKYLCYEILWAWHHNSDLFNY